MRNKRKQIVGFIIWSCWLSLIIFIGFKDDLAKRSSNRASLSIGSPLNTLSGSSSASKAPSRRPVVYLAQTPAAALLEVCVHTSANDVPSQYTLLKVVGPDSPPTVIHLKDLPLDWNARIETTQELGTQWLQKNESALLRVPSAIVPETENFLFNPLHPEGSQFRIQESYVYPFDPRLKA